MELREFHNALRIMLNIDKVDFCLAGGTDDQWPAFRDNPHMWFISASDEQAAGLWTIIQARQQKVTQNRHPDAHLWAQEQK